VYLVILIIFITKLLATRTKNTLKIHENNMK